MTLTDFDNPSIYELYNSAKKLLSLHDRMDNRQLRKDNVKSQKLHLSSHQRDDQFGHNNVLDLLSPLSVEYTSSQFMNQSQGTGVNNGSNNTSVPMKGQNNNNSNNNRKSMVNSILDITPASMNDYSPPSNGFGSSQVLSQPSVQPSQNQQPQPTKANAQMEYKMKREPSTVISPVQINRQSLTPTPNSNPTPNSYDSFSSPNSNNPSVNSVGSTGNANSNIVKPKRNSIKPIPKSNLTSSLSQQRNQSSTPTPLISSNGSISTSSNFNNSDKQPCECHNCHTLKTPLWRKDPDGNTLCNACGLFLKLHGSTRPLSLKTDVIKKRSSRRSVSSKGSNALPETLSSSQNNFNSPGSLNSNFNSFNSNSFHSNFSSPGEINDQSDNNSVASNWYGNGVGKNVNTPGSTGSTGAPTPINPPSGNVSNSNGTGNLLPRKNVLILPKPSNNDSKSIPIPNRNPGSTPNSPASPFTNEYNQSFKRKKSDLSISRKQSLSNSPYQFSNSNSFNNRKSVGSLSKRNSFVNSSNSFSNSANNNTNNNGVGSNLTISNMDLFNQNLKNPSYFDRPSSVGQFQSPTSSLPNQYKQSSRASTPGLTHTPTQTQNQSQPQLQRSRSQSQAQSLSHFQLQQLYYQQQQQQQKNRSNVETSSVNSHSSFGSISQQQNSYINEPPIPLDTHIPFDNHTDSRTFLSQDDIPQDLDWLKFEI